MDKIVEKLAKKVLAGELQLEDISEPYKTLVKEYLDENNK